MRPYSVVMVAACSFPVNYGSPGAIRELSETLSEMGHDIHIVTYPDGQDLSVGKARIHRIARRGLPRGCSAGPSREKLLLDIRMMVELCRVIRREKIEIVHAHNYEGALIALFAKLMTRKPVIYNAVNLMADELATYRFIKPAFIAKWIGAVLDWSVPIFPDHIIAVTKELSDLLMRRGVPAKRLTMIPCGTRPAMFADADPHRLLQQYAIGSRPVVMYTGINNAFQRVDYLLRAFSVVLKEHPSALLMVVSPLDNEPDLAPNQSLARELKIADNVIFAGPHTLDDLPHYIAMATVAVVPRPQCPGHPIKLLNYMISGKSIVCFAGAAKGITHMHDALIVPDHDWQKMGAAILQLLRDPALAKRLGANARQTAIENFDWQVLSRKVEAIYQSLVN